MREQRKEEKKKKHSKGDVRIWKMGGRRNGRIVIDRSKKWEGKREEELKKGGQKGKKIDTKDEKRKGQEDTGGKKQKRARTGKERRAEGNKYVNKRKE